MDNRVDIRCMLLAIGVIALGPAFPLGTATAMEMVATFTLPQLPPMIDLNGPLPGTGYAATFVIDGAPVPIVDVAALSLSDPVQSTVASALVTIADPLDGPDEVLAVAVSGAITAAYQASRHQLLLSGIDSVAHYQQVLRTLTYADHASQPSATGRQITVTVSDGALTSNIAISTVSFSAPTPPPPTVQPGGPGHHCGLGGSFALWSVLALLALRSLVVHLAARSQAMGMAGAGSAGGGQPDRAPSARGEQPAAPLPETGYRHHGRGPDGDDPGGTGGGRHSPPAPS